MPLFYVRAITSDAAGLVLVGPVVMTQGNAHVQT